MKYLSLFSGIGGFELGIQQAYVETINGSEKRGVQKNTQKNDEKGQRLESAKRKSSRTTRGQSSEYALDRTDDREPHCVGYSEIDNYAIQIYQKHFPKHENYGDITKINERTLPNFDLIVGGFPCQSFSIAGKRMGFSDTRGTLFFDIARILKQKQPRYLLLENVKGLLSHEGGDTFTTIISTLDELGYDLQWQVLNSKNFGVPQNRERVFIVGHLRGTPRPKVFPFGESDKEHFRETNLKGCTSALTGRNAGGQNRRGNYVVGTLRTHKDGNGLRELKSGVSPTIPARAREDGSGQPIIQESAEIRRLTPKECERLQGFPDDWTEGISDTQRYKCLGNAVTVNVIKAIVEKFK